jgi:hypothetical protein
MHISQQDYVFLLSIVARERVRLYTYVRHTRTKYVQLFFKYVGIFASTQNALKLSGKIAYIPCIATMVYLQQIIRYWGAIRH